MRSPVGIDAKLPLEGGPLASDLVMVARANKLYRAEVRDLPQRMTTRVSLKPPLLSDFSSWINQSRAEIAELDDGLRVYADARTPLGANLMCRVRALPVSFDVQLGCVRGFTFKNFQSGGLVLFETATQNALVFGFGYPNSEGIHLLKYESPTAFGSRLETAPERNMHFQFFRAVSIGSNIEFHHSVDGRCWSFHYAMLTTAHFTSRPDQWGFYIENNNSDAPALDLVMDILHWGE